MFLKSILTSSILAISTLTFASEPQKTNIDLDQYEIGDSPEKFGLSVIENGKMIKDSRVFTGVDVGYFELDLPDLNGSFYIEFTGYYLSNGNNTITLMSKDKSEEWILERSSDHISNIIFGESKTREKIENYNSLKAPNTYRIASNGRALKLFINGAFIGSKIQDTKTTYSKLKVTLKKQVNEIGKISFTQFVE